MRKLLKSVVLISAVLQLVSCTTHERIYSFKEIYEHCYEDGTYVSVYENSEGYIIRDTCSYAPSNSKTIYYDPQGKIIAYVGHASECYPCLLKVLYDKDGRVEYLFGSPVDDYYDYSLMKKMESSDFTCNLSYDVLCVAFHVFEGKKYTKDDYCYHFIYDKNGALKEISNPFDKSQIIRAECDTELKWSVDECPRFWESDLRGGYFIMCIQSEHRHPDGKVSVTTYNGFNIFSVDTFCDGRSEKKDLYALNLEEYYAGESDLHSFINTTVEFGENEISVTDCSSGDGMREVYSYETGRLVKYEKISKWNTVLLRRLYKWTSDDEAEYMEYSYNYNAESLELSGSGRTDKYERGIHKDTYASQLDEDNYFKYWD